MQREGVRKIGRREDVAATVVFLASHRADFTSGQTFAVNRGRTLR
ncbi:MAG TPA: SDR family oxidoreductase [Bauldia sp.]|nr:SDR family oxidoreductase [Bauldia sp.]